MKALKAKEVSVNGFGEQSAELPYPIVYQQDGWTVYYYDNTYYCMLGNGETMYLCQTVEAVRVYIPDFKPSS